MQEPLIMNEDDDFSPPGSWLRGSGPTVTSWTTRKAATDRGRREEEDDNDHVDDHKKKEEGNGQLQQQYHFCARRARRWTRRKGRSEMHYSLNHNHNHDILAQSF